MFKLCTDTRTKNLHLTSLKSRINLLGLLFNTLKNKKNRMSYFLAAMTFENSHNLFEFGIFDPGSSERFFITFRRLVLGYLVFIGQ